MATSAELRQTIARQLEHDMSSYKAQSPMPLWLIHRAFYALTMRKLEDATIGHVRWAVLCYLNDHGHISNADMRKQYDAGTPFNNDELQALHEALLEAEQ